MCGCVGVMRVLFVSVGWNTTQPTLYPPSQCSSRSLYRTAPASRHRLSRNVCARRFEGFYLDFVPTAIYRVIVCVVYAVFTTHPGAVRRRFMLLVFVYVLFDAWMYICNTQIRSDDKAQSRYVDCNYLLLLDLAFVVESGLGCKVVHEAIAAVLEQRNVHTRLMGYFLIENAC